MTKDEIIKEIISGDYRHICARMLNGNPTYKDLYQELLLIILEYPEEKLLKIPNLNQAKFFIVRILCNMVHSSDSKFHKTYRGTVQLTSEQVADEEYNYNADKEIELLQNITEETIRDAPKLERDMFAIYQKLGTYRAIEAKTGIDHTFAYRTIERTKKRIRNKTKKVKVLLMTQESDDALKYHRQLAPHARLIKMHSEISVGQRRGYKEHEKIYEPCIDDMSDEQLREFNVIYFLRQLSFFPGRNKEIVDRCHRLGLKVILDIDDNWKLSSDHYMYERYKEKGTRNNTEEALRLVDHVITTTPFFADAIRPLNKNVTVLPNCINPDDKQFIPRHIDGPRIRFGWIGGVYHRADIESMDATFCKLAKDKDVRDDIQICLGGFNYPNQEYEAIEKTMSCNYDFRYSDSTYIEYMFNFTPTSEHISIDKPYRRLWAKDVQHYGELYNEIDVALVPLRDDKFNGCKSELKIVEAGWMGKAVIVSNVLPYSAYIKDGVNGMLVDPSRNNIDWYLAIKRLTKEPERRADMGAALQETIKTHFDMDKHNQTRADLYKSLI